jgi:ABC-2 type transport system ATP-binding protein
MTEPTSAEALSIRGLEKSYPTGHIRQRRRPVLHGLTFGVERGEVFGYLGPNGSGKTTTLKILTGLLFPDAGEIRVLGLPLQDRAWRFRVGFLPEHPYLYDYLTPREYLDYVGRLFGLSARERRERTGRLLALVGLERSADVAVRRFSKGMVQRAGLAQALVNDPEFVILDEPMSGLDPIGRRMVRNVILDLKRAGKTVLFSTHILPDAETLCDRVAVLRAGRLLDVGRLADILDLKVAHMEVLVSGIDVAQLPAGYVLSHQTLGERHRLEVEEKSLGRVVQEVERLGGRILGVQPVRQSLEDYFFKEMGGEAATASFGDED